MCAFFRPRIEANIIQTTQIAVTNSSAATLLGKGGALHLRNTGAGTCFISFGNSAAVAAATTCMPLPAGTEITIRRPMEAEYIAAISGTSTTLCVTHGDL